MDFYGRILRTNLILYHKIMRTGLIDCVKTLNKNQFLSSSEASKLQLKKMRALLRYANKNIPYYNKLFKKIKFDPNIKKIEEIQKLPILTREQVRKNKNKLVNKEYDSRFMRENYTGGSSGKPLRFYQNAEYNLYNSADKIRYFNMCGWELGDKLVYLWGAYRDQIKTVEKPMLKEKIKRETWINTFNLTSENLEHGISFLNKYNPNLTVAYVSSAELFAKHILGLENKLKLRAIETSAEKLHDDQRKLIGETFNCEVFDRYGCREVGNIAHECNEHHGLHISSDIQVVEILDNENNAVVDEPGKVIVTNLTNYTMPFIRYDLEDIAILKDGVCNCGRGFPCLDKIIGRGDAIFKFSSGKTIHGAYFQEQMALLPGVEQFQIAQETKSRIIIKLIINEKFDELKFVKAKNYIIKELGEDISIEKKIVNEIERTPTGKYFRTISKVK